MGAPTRWSLEELVDQVADSARDGPQSKSRLTGCCGAGMRTIGVGNAPQALNVLPGGIDGQVAGLNQVVDGFSTFTLSTSLNPCVTAA